MKRWLTKTQGKSQIITHPQGQETLKSFLKQSNGFVKFRFRPISKLGQTEEVKIFGDSEKRTLSIYDINIERRTRVRK